MGYLHEAIIANDSKVISQSFAGDLGIVLVQLDAYCRPAKLHSSKTSGPCSKERI